MPSEPSADGIHPPPALQEPVLPDTFPVAMPDLPLRLSVTTPQQYKALADPVRTKMLGIMRHQPMTAKHLAERLGVAHGSITHHLHVLAEAGLVQVVAYRQVRGIIMPYYTRAAKIFAMHPAGDAVGIDREEIDLVQNMHDELTEALAHFGPQANRRTGFPHARLAPERVQWYVEQLGLLFDAFAQEPDDPEGQVFGLGATLMLAPPYLQVPRDHTEHTL